MESSGKVYSTHLEGFYYLSCYLCKLLLFLFQFPHFEGILIGTAQEDEEKKKSGANGTVLCSSGTAADKLKR
jgi:hypothetical protein